MNADIDQVHSAMTTFLAGQLARWEGREEDAETLDGIYDGSQRDMATGAFMLCTWLVTALAEERNETPIETARAILLHLAGVEIHDHSGVCDRCAELNDDEW